MNSIGHQQQVFISHAHEDRALAKCLNDFLQSGNATVQTTDDSIHAGQNWKREIEHAITKADVSLFVFGRNLIPIQETEARTAIEKAESDAAFRIIPVLLPECSFDALPLEIKERQIIDLRDIHNNQERFNRIAAVILVNSETGAPATDEEVGDRLFQSSDRNGSVPFYERALRIAEMQYGTRHQNVSTLSSKLGTVHHELGNLEQSRMCFERALQIDAASFGENHPTVARDLNNLAMLLQATNRLSEAESLMHRALAIDEQSYGKEHPTVAVRLNNLAQLLKATNRLAEAEPLMRRAVDVFESSLGADHPNVATCLNHLAQVLSDTGRLIEAESLMRQAMVIDERAFGTEHPDVARDLNNLAALLQDRNHLTEAEPLMRRALKIDEQSFGKDHPLVAVRLNNLAQLLKATNRLTEAEPLMRRALSIDENIYGREHPLVAIDLNNLALLLSTTKRQSEAEFLMRRHVEILRDFEKNTGHVHPHMQVGIANYVSLLQDMKLSCQMIQERLIVMQVDNTVVMPSQIHDSAPCPMDNKLDRSIARKSGRNSPCPCGSGKKYKKCCGS